MDAKLVHNGSFFDLELSGPDLETDSGLYTAVVISLFTDRRAEADDEIPDGTDDRRGWWADTYADNDGDLIGSRLWLLSREKHLPEIAARVKQYAEEALAWMIEDSICKKVEVTAELQNGGMLAMRVQLTRPDKSAVTYRFDNLWEAMNGI